MRKEKIELIINDIRGSLPLYLLIFCQLLLVFDVVGFGSDFLVKIAGASSSSELSDDGRNNNYYVKTATDDEITVSYSDEVNELSYFIGENFKTVGLVYLNSFVYGDDISGDIDEVCGVTPYFFDYYEITAQDGRLFSQNEYGNDGNNIPVVIGNALSDKYSVGDKFLDKYEIVGILPPSCHIYVAYSITDNVKVSADDMVFLPLMNASCLRENYIDYPSQLIFANDKSELSAINSKAAELNKYGYNFISLSELAKLYSDKSLSNSLLMIITGAIILTLCLFCLIETMLTYVRKNMSELLIHVICGATVNDIIIRIGAGTFIAVMLSGIIMAVILHTLTALIAIFVTGLISVIISLVPVIIALKKRPLIIAVKEEKL